MQPLPPIEQKYTGWRLFLTTIVGRAYPRVIGQQREQSWWLFEILMPLLSVSAYVFVYRAIGAPEDYTGFAVLGGAMTAFWLNVLWNMSNQLYWEKETGNLALYIVSPANMMAILLGMAIGGLFATCLRATVIILVGSLLFQVTFVLHSLWLLLAVFFVTMAGLYGLGMMTASLFLFFGREAWHYGNLAQEPVYLVTGFYFPVKNFNIAVAAGASLIPLTLGMDAMRQLVFSSGPSLGFLSIRLEILILAGLAVAFVVAARILLGRMERLAVREGRLTESRR